MQFRQSRHSLLFISLLSVIYSEAIRSSKKMMSILCLAHLTAEQIQLDWLRLAHAGLVHRLFILPRAYLMHAWCSLTKSLRSPPVTQPHHQWGAVWRTGPTANRTLPGSVCPRSNMFPAWRRGNRTGSSTVPLRTMTTAGRTEQVGQVWVSCWVLLLTTCVLGAKAQGKTRNSVVFIHTGLLLLIKAKKRAGKCRRCRYVTNVSQTKTVAKLCAFSVEKVTFVTGQPHFNSSLVKLIASDNA